MREDRALVEPVAIREDRNLDERPVALRLTIFPEVVFLSLDEAILWEAELRRECTLPEAVPSLVEPSRLDDNRFEDGRLEESRLEDSRLDDAFFKDLFRLLTFFNELGRRDLELLMEDRFFDLDFEDLLFLVFLDLAPPVFEW